MVVAETNDKMLHVEEVHSNTTSPITVVTGSSDDAEEAFTCTQCEQTFLDRDTLFRHVKEFHQQHVRYRRAFRCDVCRRSFKSMIGLKNHSRTHSIYYETAQEMASQLLSTSILQESFLSAGVSSTQEQSSADSKPSMDTECTDVSRGISPTETDTSDIKSNVTFTLSSNGGLDENSAMDIEDNIITSVTSVDDNDAEKSDLNTRKRLTQRRRSGIPIRFQHSKCETNTVQSILHNDESIREASVLVKSNSITHAEDTCSSNTTEGEQPRRLTSRLSSKQFTTRQSSTKRPPSVKCRTPKRRHQTPDRSAERAVPKNNKKGLNIASPFAKTLSTKISSPVISLDTPRTPVNGKRTPGSNKRTPVRSCATPTGSKIAHTCWKCGKSFLDKAKLEVHFTLHARETPEKCGIPKQTLKRNLERAEVSHSPKKTQRSDDTPYSCNFCDKKFRYLSLLRAHSYVHQGETQEHVQGFETDRKHGMTHKNDILTSGRYQKWDTTNIFSLLTTAESLDADLIDLPYTCKMCTYTSLDPTNLLVHMKSHTRTGPFACKHCDKSYKLQSNLRTHEKVHTVNKLKDFLIGKQATRKQ